MQSTASYMLIFRETSPETYKAMSLAQIEQCLDRWNDWVEGIVTSGKLQAGHPLEPAGRIVGNTRNERVLDGPFAEAKETIGGYLIVNVANQDEAIAIAERCPNIPYGMTVEVRPVATACHLAKALGRNTMRAVEAISNGALKHSAS